MSEGQVTAVAVVVGVIGAVMCWAVFLRYRWERRLRVARERLLEMAARERSRV